MGIDQQEYWNTIKEFNNLNNFYIPIGLHSKGISEYLFTKSRSFENISQWFHIADGIKDLDYDGINYDSGFFMCRPAYEYERDRQQLFHRLVKEITLFSYLYSGLEAIINVIHIRPCSKNRGKINAATNLIQDKYPYQKKVLSLYLETLSLLNKMFRITLREDFQIWKELKNKCVDFNGLGLRIIYKIRNIIMHGDFFFPEPLDYSSVLPFQPEIVQLSSRLILLNSQMILLTQIESEESEIFIYNSCILEKGDNEDDPIITEKNYLEGLHCKRPESIYEQYKLDFFN